eukprot:2519844-Pyramimonas_sp.AAC.2
MTEPQMSASTMVVTTGLKLAATVFTRFFAPHFTSAASNSGNPTTCVIHRNPRTAPYKGLETNS